MRVLLHVGFPHEPFNAAIRDGTIEKKIKRILKETQPEAAYFTECEGRRAAILVVDLKEPSQVPSLAEPWFLTFNADVEIRVAMTPEDLDRTGIGELGKTWS